MFLYFCGFIKGRRGVRRLYVESRDILHFTRCVLDYHFQSDILFEPFNGVLEVTRWIILLESEGYFVT